MRFGLPPVLFLLVLLASVSKAEETRTWTSSDGKEIKGTILGLEGTMITLETDRGKFEIPLSRLSEPDQKFASDWAEAKMTTPESSEGNSDRPTAPTLGNFDNLSLGEWPQYIVAELELEQIVTVDAADLAADSDEDGDGESNADSGGELFLYRTPHFEFRAPDRLSTSVVREFARIFEATYAFVDQMPIGLAPAPSANGYYKTELYMTRDSYYADGGPPGSGGVFSWRMRGDDMSGIIKVPLPNLGVEYTGTRFIVDHDKQSDTLTHEIVHQVMLRWLATPMPVWLSEGIAEVISSQDYDNGRFKLSSMDRSIAEVVTRNGGREFSMVPLERLMTITHDEWSSELTSGRGGMNYNSANVLAYYFLRLDGEGNAAHLVEFLKTLPGSGRRGDDVAEATAEFLLRGRSYEQLQEDLATAWRSEGLQVEFR